MPAPPYYKQNRLKQLRARARSEECDDGSMAEAMDSDDPKAAFVQLLLELGLEIVVDGTAMWVFRGYKCFFSFFVT